MVNYIKVSKDLSGIKQKFFAGLTKRQTICFAIGFACGLPVYFITKHFGADLTISLTLMMIFSAPGIFCGLYQKNGLYLEQHVKNMIKFYKRGKVLTYQSENPYQQISDEIEIQKIKHTLKQNGVHVIKKKKGALKLGRK